MLSESLVAVISQSLLKRKDGSGRIAAHEIMLGNSAIRNLIRENKIAQMCSGDPEQHRSGHDHARPMPAGRGRPRNQISAMGRRPMRVGGEDVP